MQINKYRLIPIGLTFLLLSGCGSKNIYNDGTYIGIGTVLVDNEYGYVNYEIETTLVVEDGKITELYIDPAETDEDVETMITEFQAAYIDTDKPEDAAEVDAISGATVSYNAIEESIMDALGQAQNP